MSVRPVRGGPTKKTTGGSSHNIALVYLFDIEKEASKKATGSTTSLRSCK